MIPSVGSDSGSDSSTHASMVHIPSVPSSIQVQVLHPSPAGILSPGAEHFGASWAKSLNI